MNLAITVFDITSVRDVFGALFRKMATLLPVVFVLDEEAAAKEAEQTPVDNNSPPETLGIGITEEVNTKEAMG